MYAKSSIRLERVLDVVKSFERDGVIQIATRTLAERLGRSAQYASEALRTLEMFGIIEYTRSQTRHVASTVKVIGELEDRWGKVPAPINTSRYGKAYGKLCGLTVNSEVTVNSEKLTVNDDDFTVNHSISRYLSTKFTEFLSTKVTVNLQYYIPTGNLDSWYTNTSYYYTIADLKAGRDFGNQDSISSEIKDSDQRTKDNSSLILDGHTITPPIAAAPPSVDTSEQEGDTMPIKLRALPPKAQERIQRALDVQPRTPKAKVTVKPSKIGPDAIQRFWMTAYSDNYPKVAVRPFTAAQKGMAKNISGALAEQSKDFVDYIFANWPAIRSDVFGWMTKQPAPQYPEIGFVVKFLTKLLDCYNGAVRIADLKALDIKTKENQIEMMTRMGMSLRDAKATVAAREERQVMLERKKASHAVRTARPHVAALETANTATVDTAPAPAVTVSMSSVSDSDDPIEIATRNGPVSAGERLTLVWYATNLMFEDDLTGHELVGRNVNEAWTKAAEEAGLERFW